MENIKTESMKKHAVTNRKKVTFSKKRRKELKIFAAGVIILMISVTTPKMYKVYKENEVLQTARESFENKFQHFYLVQKESKNEETGYYEYSESYRFDKIAIDVLNNYDDFDQSLYFAYNRFPNDKVENMNLLFEEISNIVHQNPEAYVGIPLYKSFDDYCLQKNFIDDLGRSDVTIWKTYCVKLQELENKEPVKKLTLHKSEKQ